MRRVLGAVGAIALLGLSVAGYLGGSGWSPDTEVVRAPAGCPGLPSSTATATNEQVAAVVPAASAPTAIDHAPRAPDLRAIFDDARALLGGFDVLQVVTLASSGIEVEVRSDGPLTIDEAELDALARLPLERHATFSDARVAALLACYEERVLVERELEGTRLRLYVPSDSASCFRDGQLSSIGDGGYRATCDAAAFTLPGVPLEVRLFGREVARFRNEATIVASGAAHDPVAAETRLAYNLVHELVHHYDNALGLGPWEGQLSHYEQRAYYIERTLRGSLEEEGGPPRAIRYRAP